MNNLHSIKSNLFSERELGAIYHCLYEANHIKVQIKPGSYNIRVFGQIGTNWSIPIDDVWDYVINKWIFMGKPAIDMSRVEIIYE